MVALWLANNFHSHDKEVDDSVGVRANDSGTKTFAEMSETGKYAGLGRPPARDRIPGCWKYFMSPFNGEVSLAFDNSERW